jgi:eukaryotic-like serine/threonine-protein kinase
MQDPLVGQVIEGRYQIQHRIGEGGMGVVYKARQTPLDRVIAIKMLNAQMADDPNWVQRFFNEAKACARLQHPNTIRMFDFGRTPDGRMYMTMEFLDGLSLRDALAKGPLAAHRVVKILIQCCASLAEAHSIGIIHRDIKPDNVFLLNMAGSPDFVKLLDFSVAKLLESDRMKTQAGVVFGTPQYMSPEQGRGAPLDARSDLYALGILAFEMLTGAVPFHDENPMTVIQMHLHAGVPPLPQTIPYSVQQIVRRALEKEPSRRYQSAGEMMQHCQQVFAEVSGGVSIGAGGMPRTMIAQPQNIPGAPGMGPPQGMYPGPPGMNQSGMNPNQQLGYQPTMLPTGGPPGMPQPGPHGMQGPQMGMPPGGPPGMPGMGPPGMGMPHGRPPPDQAKTMIAQQSPFAPGGPGLPGMPPPPAGMPGMQPGMQQPQGAPGHGGYNAASPQQKTIMAMAAPNVPGPLAVPGQQPGFPPMQPSGGANKTVMLKDTEGLISAARMGQPIQAMGTGQPIQPGRTGVVQQGASTLFWIVSLVIGVAVGALAYVIVLQL